MVSVKSLLSVMVVMTAFLSQVSAIPPLPEDDITYSPGLYRNCVHKCHSSALANNKLGELIPGFNVCAARCSYKKDDAIKTLCLGYCFEKTIALADPKKGAKANRQAGSCISC
ncbi:MAG: hypothetical protein J3Q66DRAFT_346956 [Benniella sp.]|nr:MAG: hypothetical protein J3Q66DRAFT_346956 [Benniella sp.]